MNDSQSSYKGFMASSADATGQTLSLTIESVAKILIGIIGWWGMSHVGFNVAAATTQIQAITDIIAQSAPMVFALWSACLMAWGLIRKMLSNFKTVPPTFAQEAAVPPIVPPVSPA